MAMIRTAAIGIITFVLTLALALWASALEPLSASTCQVSVAAPGGGQYQGTGVCVWKDDQRFWVLSAYHVVREMQSWPTVYFPLCGETHRVSRITRMREGDVVVLQIDSTTQATAAPVSATDPQVGQVIVQEGWAHGKHATRKNGRILNLRKFQNASGLSQIEWTQPSPEGLSGGPAYDEHGHVVAIAWGSDHAATMGVAAPHIRRMLKACGWPSQCFGGRCPPVTRPPVRPPVVPPVQPPVVPPPEPCKDGAPGRDGRGIESVRIQDGNLIVVFSDGTEHDAGRVVGRDGLAGLPGQDGAPGRDGTIDIASLPPQRLRIRYVDVNGNEIGDTQEVSAPLGEPLKVRFKYGVSGAY